MPSGLATSRLRCLSPNDFQDVIDFHEIVTAMNQYPTLLRRLGLVVDLLVPRDAFQPATESVALGRGGTAATGACRRQTNG